MMKLVRIGLFSDPIKPVFGKKTPVYEQQGYAESKQALFTGICLAYYPPLS
jgi:hypothetical protein